MKNFNEKYYLKKRKKAYQKKRVEGKITRENRPNTPRGSPGGKSGETTSLRVSIILKSLPQLYQTSQLY